MRAHADLFGEPPEFDAARRYDAVVPFEEQLGALSRAVDQGKVLSIGVSNETPYGLMRFQQLADARPRNRGQFVKTDKDKPGSSSGGTPTDAAAAKEDASAET